MSTRLKTISVAGTVAAFVAAATAVYIMLIASQGVGSHLGRIFFFVPGFIAMWPRQAHPPVPFQSVPVQTQADVGP
jgi:hypothetical protein